MKKALMIGLMLVISIAFVTSVFAQSATDKATKAATDAATDKAKAEGGAMKDKATKAATDKAAATAAPAPAAPAAPAKAAAPAPAAPAPEKKGAKAKTHQYTGEVTKMDMAAKSIVVKGQKGDMTFDVGMAKMKGDPKEGDKIMVKYTEKDGKMMASSVTKAAATKPAAKKPAAPAPEKK